MPANSSKVSSNQMQIKQHYKSSQLEGSRFEPFTGSDSVVSPFLKRRQVFHKAIGLSSKAQRTTGYGI